MIPYFPEFKKLEYSDKADIEKFTKNHLPYSDFNFTSMWSWNTEDKMAISQLDSHLIIQFSDYINGDLFYSIIGDTNTEAVISTFFHFFKDKDETVELRLLPESMVENLNIPELYIEHDRDNGDYIYDIEKLCSYNGGTYTTKRNLVNRFMRQHPITKVEILDLQDAGIQNAICALEEIWCDHKDSKNTDVSFANEVIALRRLFSIANNPNFVTVGIFEGATLIGFCINELLQGEYAISHFAKTIPDSPGAYAYLMRENAFLLKEYGKKMLNFEQDLGIPTLRHAKQSFRPHCFFNKYRCTLKINQDTTIYSS